MKFKKQDLIAMVDEEHDDSVFEIIKNDIHDTRRWYVCYELIFSFEGDFYRSYYSVGDTEDQDESPYENEADLIECRQVWPHKVEVIEYKTTPPGE